MNVDDKLKAITDRLHQIEETGKRIEGAISRHSALLCGLIWRARCCQAHCNQIPHDSCKRAMMRTSAMGYKAGVASEDALRELFKLDGIIPESDDEEANNQIRAARKLAVKQAKHVIAGLDNLRARAKRMEDHFHPRLGRLCGPAASGGGEGHNVAVHGAVSSESESSAPPSDNEEAEQPDADDKEQHKQQKQQVAMEQEEDGDENEESSSSDDEEEEEVDMKTEASTTKAEERLRRVKRQIPIQAPQEQKLQQQQQQQQQQRKQPPQEQEDEEEEEEGEDDDSGVPEWSLARGYPSQLRFYPRFEEHALQGGGVLIAARLPGVDAQDVAVRIVDDKLVIAGVKHVYEQPPQEDALSRLFFGQRANPRTRTARWFEKVYEWNDGHFGRPQVSLRQGILRVELPRKRNKRAEQLLRRQQQQQQEQEQRRRMEEQRRRRYQQQQQQAAPWFARSHHPQQRRAAPGFFDFGGRGFW